MHTFGLLTSFVAFLLGSLVNNVSSWSFHPIPEPVVFDEGTNTVSVVCVTDRPLTKCQFNIHADDHSYPLIDLSRGPESGVIVSDHYRGNWTVYNARYNGTGLQHGQCGATFTSNYFVFYLLGCRGRDALGEWQQMSVSVLNPRKSVVSSSLKPSRAVVLPGSRVSFLSQTSSPLFYCSILLPNKSREPIVVPKKFTQVETADHNRYSYNGNGVEHGECGLTITNITEADNGPVAIMAFSTEEESVYRISSLIVYAPPQDTALEFNTPIQPTDVNLKASCSSFMSRPVANITWLLDDVIYRQDAKNDDVLESEWLWPWDFQNITQTVTVPRNQSTIGKKLKCRIEILLTEGTDVNVYSTIHSLTIL